MHSKEKIKKIRERALLREYINLHLSKVLKEQDDYGDYDSYSDYGGGGGGGYGKGWETTSQFFKSDFAKLFGLDSIANALEAGKYAVKTTLTKAVGEVKILAKTLFYTIIPFIKPDDVPNVLYMAEQDRNEINRELQSISREYSEVFKKNQEIFQNPDFKFAAFLASPGLYIGNELVDKSVGVAAAAYDTIVGSDSHRSGISRDIEKSFDKLFSALIPSSDKSTRQVFEQQLFQELKQSNPNLTEQEIRSVLGNFASILNEAPQPVAIQQTQQSSILSTPAGQQFYNELNAKMNELKSYLSSRPAQLNVATKFSSVENKAHQILANKVLEAAAIALKNLKLENVIKKPEVNAAVNDFFTDKKIDENEKQELLKPGSEFSKQLDDNMKVLSDNVKKTYIEQLNTLLKLNPNSAIFRDAINQIQKM